MRYREWALMPDRRRGCMLPVSIVDKFSAAPDAGYASVYEFDEADALDIRDSGSSAGLARFDVTAATLTLDLDKGTGQLNRTKDALRALGLGYSVYDSGGKGYHVVVTTQETRGKMYRIRRKSGQTPSASTPISLFTKLDTLLAWSGGSTLRLVAVSPLLMWYLGRISYSLCLAVRSPASRSLARAASKAPSGRSSDSFSESPNRAAAITPSGPRRTDLH